MIQFKSHIDMMSCWNEAGRPLCDDTVTAIKNTAVEMKRIGVDDNWLVFEGQCRICNFRQNIICPADNDIDNQECGNCGNMAMMERETPEWEEGTQNG